MRRKHLILFGTTFLFLGLLSSVFAVNTARWELNNKVSFRQGELQNLLLDYEGRLLPGKMVRKISTKEPSIWISVLDRQGVPYVGSGSGKVYKLVDQKLIEVYATGELLVTSMVVSKKNELFVGTIPHGKIFKVDKKGQGSLFATVPVEYVWALAFNKKNDLLYAATGPGGKLFKIDRAGQVDLFYETKRENILSLVLDQNDDLYLGTANPGVLYRVTSEGKPAVLYNFGEAEIKSLFLDQGILYVAVNRGSKLPPQEFLDAVNTAAAQPTKNEQETTDKSPSPATPTTKETSSSDESSDSKPVVQSTIYRFVNPDQLSEVIAFENCYLTEIKVTKKGEIIAGTDNTGKVFQIRADGKLSIPVDLETKQVLTFLLNKDGLISLIGTGGQGQVCLVDQNPPATSTYLSDILDARFPSQWGTCDWQGNGPVTVQTRSGNTEKPDETWSDWSADLVKPGKINSPVARYLQFRINWKEAPEAFVEKISVAYLVKNQRPRLTTVTVGAADASAVPSGKGASAAGGSSTGSKTLKKIIWQASDVDNDTLVFRIHYKGEKRENWILLNPREPLSGSEYVWNTEAIPDGKYFIKVGVSDEKSNPPARVRKDEKISTLVLVDNTRPVIKNLTINKTLECSGEVADNFNYIEKIEYSLGGTKWELVYPVDNLFDERVEKFSFQIANLKSGNHTLMIRSWDSNGNMGVAQKEFKVK